MRSSRLLVVCVLLWSGLVGFTPAASAETLACGSVVEDDVVLATDLICTGTALIVRGNAEERITIDLGGHTLTGTDSTLVDTAGVLVEDAWPYTDVGVTVRNGTIERFANGVRVFHENDVTLEDLTLLGNEAAIRNSWVTFRLQVRNSRMIDNAATYRPGWSAGGMRFEDNIVVDSGLLHMSQSGGNTFRGNTFVRSSVSGFMAPGTTVEDNTFAQAPVALSLGHLSGYSTVRGNVFRSNGVGLSLADVGSLNPRTADTVIEDNTFVRNATAGALLDFAGANPSRPEAVFLRRNRFVSNGQDPDGRVDHGGNAVRGGLHVFTGEPTVPVTLTANRAVANGGYGIAAYDVSDGGGNRGVANDAPEQCLGVTC